MIGVCLPKEKCTCMSCDKREAVIHVFLDQDNNFVVNTKLINLYLCKECTEAMRKLLELPDK